MNLSYNSDDMFEVRLRWFPERSLAQSYHSGIDDGEGFGDERRCIWAAVHPFHVVQQPREAVQQLILVGPVKHHQADRAKIPVVSTEEEV